MTQQTENLAAADKAAKGSVSPAGKVELIDYVSRDLDTTKQDSKLIVESVIAGIVELTMRHKLMRLPNLGNFRVLETAARRGRNPRTGEVVPISPSRRITFRAAKGFKSGINKKGVR